MESLWEVLSGVGQSFTADKCRKTASRLRQIPVSLKRSNGSEHFSNLFDMIPNGTKCLGVAAGKKAP